MLQIEADYLKVYPLDAQGQAGEYFSLSPVSEGRFLLSIDQAAMPSLWFGIEAVGGNITAIAEPTESREPLWMEASPSPIRLGQPLRLSWLPNAGPLYFQLSNSQGQSVSNWTHPDGLAGEDLVQLPHPLPSGIYYLQMRNKQGQQAHCRLVLMQ